MKKIYIITGIVVFCLLSCENNTKQKVRETKILNEKNFIRENRIVSDTLTITDKKCNRFISQIENKLKKNYIQYYLLNTENNLSTTKNLIIGGNEFQIKILKNNDKNNDRENKSKFNIIRYDYEIRKFRNGVVEVLLQGNYLILSSESDSSPVIDFFKSFFVVNDKTLIIYSYRAPSRYEMYYKYLLKKDSYTLNNGKLNLINKQIYLEDYEISNELHSDTKQMNSFQKPSDDYISYIEKKYNASFVNKETLREDIIYLMLDDFNDMLIKK